jgi:hypothetical protein
MTPAGTSVRSQVLGVVVLLVAGCSTTPPSSPTPPSPPSSPALHTVDVSDPGYACAGVGLVDATLHGSPTDPRVAWIDLHGFGQRAALFPTGYSARFDPSLEVLDTSGNVKFREGDKIDGACGASDGGMLIGWP